VLQESIQVCHFLISSAVNSASLLLCWLEVYEPNVVGMIWSILAQEQTWFGNEVWKAYGIQLLPLTEIAELRDDAKWIKQMLPKFQASCLNDPGLCIHPSFLLFTNLFSLCPFCLSLLEILSLLFSYFFSLY
jgi:hypothetical protein